jgi:hypothetical protein
MTGFSNDALNAVLNAAYQAYISRTNWVSVYNAISDAIVANPSAQSSAEPAALTWIRGAADVNGPTGPFADYIRNYTAAQYQMRSGQSIATNALQDSSNQIASNFAFQFLFGINANDTRIPRDGTGAIDWTGVYDIQSGTVLLPTISLSPAVPSLQTIGAIDAGAAASLVYRDQASSTVAPNYSPWAGTVLFTNLGDSSFFTSWILDLKSNTALEGRKVESGTYDLISVAQATAQATTLSGALDLLVLDPTRYSQLQGLQEVNRAVIADATASAQSFFENAYGSDLSSIPIGADIFDPTKALATPSMTFQVGTVHDDSLDLSPLTLVLNAGAGNDRVNVVASLQSAPTAVVIDGGDGSNTLAYQNSDVPLTVTLQNAGVWNIREKIDLGPQHGTEYAYNFQTLKLAGNGDKVIWGAGFSPTGITGAAASGPIKIIEQASSANAVNTVDLSNFAGSIGLKSSQDGSALELFQDPKFSQTTRLQFQGFSNLILGDGNNNVILRQKAALGLHTLDTGDGNNTVDSTVANLRINFGNGNDTLMSAGAGSVVNAGQGNDIFHLSNDVLLTGVKHTDKIMIGDQALTGGILFEGSESPWAVGIDGTRYGFNELGQLVIKDAFGDLMYVSNPITGPGTFTTDTAGLYIGELSLTFVRLADLKAPYPNWQTHQFEYVNALSKAYSQTAIYRGVDPIVLDLNGGGLHLTDTSSAAPLFDINGNGFAVRTGWVQSGTGILVLDKNGDGQIGNVSEMFGGPGLDGFAALAAYDTDQDGVIDASDAIFSQLQVWVDANGDGVSDPGELETLAELGIASIDLTAQTLTGVSPGSLVAGNQILETGHFTRSDGSTGTVADVALHVNNYETQYRGDISVTAAAAGLPNEKGYGTLTDLSVALSHDPALANPSPGPSLQQVLGQTLPSLSVLDLPTLRDRVTPILTAWAAASQVINPDGTLSSVAPSGHSDLPILVNTAADGASVVDFAYQVSEAEGGYWKRASGIPVLDDQGHVIAHPTLEQVVGEPATSGQTGGQIAGQWTTVSGAQLDFMERYLGDKLPLGSVPDNPAAALSALGPVVTQLYQTLNELAVSIAMQGPLAPYFAGIAYDVTTNTFQATTADQLAPMYEAIFQAAPADAAGATQWLQQWKPILDVVLGDFARGQGEEVTYGYRFVNVVAAYEAAGLPVDIRSAASALGIPSDLIFAGGATLDGTGTSDADLFYLSDGDQTAIGGRGPDNYIVGGHIGHDTIIDDKPALSGQLPSTLRFASFKSTDVIASRDGLDLILRVKGTDEQVTVRNQFFGVSPGILGGNLSDAWGVSQITFADGVVWEAPDIAFAVAPNTDGVNGRLIGTGAMDVLDGGRGNHFLSGGNGGDIYLYDRGDGADMIAVNKTNIFSNNPNYVSFGPGLGVDDVVFTRNGASSDLLIQIRNDPGDTLIVQGQFDATFTGVFDTQYLDQIQNFRFADGTILTWKDVQDAIIAQEEATPGVAIYGFASGDTIDPGLGGNRFMSGGNGEHTYVFGLGYGNDTLEVDSTNILSGSVDTVLFNPDVDPSQVQVVRNGNSKDVTLALPDGSTLTIVNQFDRAVPLNIWFDRVQNFQFQDANHTLWTYQDIQEKVIQYEIANGDHAVYGTPADDTLDPGQGTGWFLSSGDGNDTYVFGLGYGHDTVSTDAQVGGSKTLLFNADVDPSAVHFWGSTNTDELEIVLADGSELDVRNQFGAFKNEDAIGNFQFQDADHTLLTYDDIRIRVYRDEIANGRDTFIYGADAGDLNLQGFAGWYGGSLSAVLKFTDLNAADLTLSRVAGTLQITVNSTGKTITAPNNFDGAVGLSAIEFADGTSWGKPEIASAAWYRAGAGDVTVQAQGGDAVLVAGTGNDTLIGGNGNDTFVYSITDGNLEITDNPLPWWQVTNVLKLTDLNRADLVFGRMDVSLQITVAATGKTITIDNEYYGNDGVRSIQFADGSVWGMSEIVLAGVYRAGPGDVTVQSLDEDSTLVAGTGNDTLIGGNGNNTFVYEAADGNTIIKDNPTYWWNNYTNTLELTDLNVSDLSFSQVGQSLVIAVNATGRTITIDQEDFGYNGVQVVKFADGTTWTESDIVAALSLHVGPGQSLTMSGDGLSINVAESASLALNGSSNFVDVRGDNSGVVANGDNNEVDLDGNSDTATLSGAQNRAIISGTNASVTVGGDYGAVTAYGDAATIAGTGAGIAAFAYGDNATIDLATDGGFIALDGQAAHVVINGSNDEVNFRGGAAQIAIQGDYASVNSYGEDATISIVGAYGGVTAAGTNDTVEIDGDYAYAGLSGNNESVTLVGGGAYVDFFAVNANLAIEGNAADTIVYYASGGNLEIRELSNWTWGGTPSANILQFSDLNLSDLTVARVGSDLDITVNATDALITIAAEFTYDAQGNNAIQQIQFADGSFYQLQIASDTMVQNPDGSTTTRHYDGAGTLTSQSIDGPNGHDITVYGVTGQAYVAYENVYDASWSLTSQNLFYADGSTYQSETVTANGDGTTTTRHYDGSGTLTSRSTDGPNSHDVTVYGVTGQAYAAYENVYDASWNLTSQNLFNADGSTYQSETVTANGDGTTTTRHYDGSGILTSRSTDGPNGHDITVYGVTDQAYAAYENVYDAAWNLRAQSLFNTDGSISSGTGVYAFGLGHGQRTIDAVAGTGTVEFTAGVGNRQLWFERAGDDLQVDLLGSNDRLTVADWFGGNASPSVESFGTADGSKLDTQLTQLVTAMASFTTSHPGFDATQASSMPADANLLAVVAASWHS